VPAGGEIHLEQAEFRLLRELFNEHCGILFGPEARPILERRLRDRISQLGLHSFSEYYQLLRFEERGRSELDEATDLITINETYFFREMYQLRAYREEVLPMLRVGASARDRLSVWSAGCSTGEEVYSIAMLTREAGLYPSRAVRIFGSDISRRCVVQARRGVYGPSAFRAIPPEMRRRYFYDRPEGMHVVEELRALCQFGQLNLLDSARASVVGRVDVIFCRNVMIYFDEESRRRVIEMFYDRLLPGGFLLLGHSESLLNISTAFELVHLREDLVYRKPITATRPGASYRPAVPEPRVAVSSIPEPRAPMSTLPDPRATLPTLTGADGPLSAPRFGGAPRAPRPFEGLSALSPRVQSSKPSSPPGTGGDKR
jgi:chemotaxis protein methyltransferase CheR